MTLPRRWVVTGMHRSGTSFVASLLAAWKIRMGDRRNPTGTFEDLDFLELNRRILVACTPPEEGHRDWGWTESERFDAGLLPAHRDAAAALVAARDRGSGPWGWEDSRTSMLLGFWDDVLARDARYLLLYRHPWDVADSMLRTGTDVLLTHPGYPARIWTHYNRRILDFHRSHRDRTLLVSANRIQRDPEAFAATMRPYLGIDVTADTVARLHADGSFVSRPDNDPMPRLWRCANAESMDLLGELDDAADLGNDRCWEAASRAGPRLSPQRPRLSVIVPCHEDGDYLIHAMASVERNTPAETELIVVDDGSTELRTRQVLAAIREAGHRVIEQPQCGLSAARNRGIAEAAGDYLLPLDADNCLLPGFAAEALALLDSEPAVGVVYGDRREFGGRQGDVAVPQLDVPRLLWSNYIDACAVFRRAVWSDVGGFDVAFLDWEDWDFWLGAVERGWRFVHLSRPAFEYRIRPDSLHHRFLRRDDYPPVLRRIYEKHRALVSEHASEILVAAHVERRQLFRDAAALRASRDGIQLEIDRLTRLSREQIDALKKIVAARNAESSAVESVSCPDEAAPQETALTGATQVFTIIARNYLAHARVLAASLSRHNPGVRLSVIILDDPDRSVAPEPLFEIIWADELPFDPPSELYTMAAFYDVMELATAVKPWGFEHLFDRGASVVIYLDPDIEVFHSLGLLEPLAREHGILLTPHVTEPLPADGKRPDERDLMLSGIYNLGFLALSSHAARTFLPWWRERLRRNCLNDQARGMFVDQRWLDYAPAMFSPGILKDPGYNVAYWNLAHRVCVRDGNRILVNGQPLRFFHYSGFSPRAPHLLSKHQLESPRIRLSDHPLLAELCAGYAAALSEAGFAECSVLPYRFSATAAGLKLDAWARRVLRRTYLDDEAHGRPLSFPNPFSEAGAGDVVSRLLRPSPHGGGVPGYLGEIWNDRVDLRLAFPRINSVDAERFLDWVRTQGVREHDIAPELVPPSTPAVRPRPARDEKLTPGVTVYGYAFAESGTGQIVRSVAAALAAEGIPYAVVPFEHTISRQQHVFRDLGTETPAFDTNLICVNADQVPVFFESMAARLRPGTRNIGLWAWEVEDLPAAMAASELHFDEVWGISSFTTAALARALTKPVRAFPLPVEVPEVRRRTRAELGMPDGFLFLFCFDYDSVFRRKNPLAVVAAFRQAFSDGAGVALYIKTTNAERHTVEHEALLVAIGACPNIVLRDGYVASGDYFSMVDACDCYVSLHRSEGFGLTVAEAMALGKPVICTAYSATLEFADETNSFPVPASIVEVGDNALPYPPHSRWAEPDVAVAAQQMARVHADRIGAAAVGARARAAIAQLHGPSARGPLLRRLLDEHRRTLDAYASLAQSAAAQAMAEESRIGSPMRRLLNAVRPLARRCLRVRWVQALGIDRAVRAVVTRLRRVYRRAGLASPYAE